MLFSQAAGTPAETLIGMQLSVNVQPQPQIRTYDVLALDGSHRILNESDRDADVTFLRIASRYAIQIKRTHRMPPRKSGKNIEISINTGTSTVR
ncbi:hypothetical protein [Burkholderia sp. RF4-BP95]|uniref:hypothetical protein n=1 Tax=Burkholderia sp. RF4-BP95 TaxID=1637845 RepID=UPI000A507782|nr:hypothetical protein [Burkholderia sp. RF4-BP95]